jgi:hypothetical protein
MTDVHVAEEARFLAGRQARIIEQDEQRRQRRFDKLDSAVVGEKNSQDGDSQHGGVLGEPGATKTELLHVFWTKFKAYLREWEESVKKVEQLVSLSTNDTTNTVQSLELSVSPTGEAIHGLETAAISTSSSSNSGTVDFSGSSQQNPLSSDENEKRRIQIALDSLKQEILSVRQLVLMSSSCKLVSPFDLVDTFDQAIARKASYDDLYAITNILHSAGHDEFPASNVRLLHQNLSHARQVLESARSRLLPRGKFIFKRHRAVLARQQQESLVPSPPGSTIASEPVPVPESNCETPFPSLDPSSNRPPSHRFLIEHVHDSDITVELLERDQREIVKPEIDLDKSMTGNRSPACRETMQRKITILPSSSPPVDSKVDVATTMHSSCFLTEHTVPLAMRELLRCHVVIR